MEDKVTGFGKIKVEEFNKKTGELINCWEMTNGWPTASWNELLKLIIGSSANHFNTANVQIGVGDSSTAFDAGDADLKAATNKTYKNVTSGYPTAPSSGTTQFVSTFNSSDANYAWNEIVVKNVASGVIWNRTVSSMGTKTTAVYRTVTITLGKA